MTKNKITVRSYKTWKKKDYLIAVSMLLLAFVATICFYLMAIALNTVGDRVCEITFTGYFVTYWKDFIYLCLSSLLLYLSIFVYMVFENTNKFVDVKVQLLLYTVICTTLFVSVLMQRFVNMYARPVVLSALLAGSLFGKKNALFLNTIMCFFMLSLDVFVGLPFVEDTSNIVKLEYIELITSFITGVVAVYFVSMGRTRFGLISYGLLLVIPETVCVVALTGFTELTGHLIIFSVLSGVVAVVLATVCLPVFEVLFNCVTNYRLAELTDHDNKILRELREVAPGTFNHSVVVANLAEACAMAIGENPALARACAYYHDIGKIEKVPFFSENQSGENIHDDLTPELSVNIIRDHAKRGYELAKKYRLPDEIARACLEHHGTLPIKYFYAKALKMTEGELDIKNYSYQGPKPQSKITAIIMIADACEAIVRTRSQRTREDVDKIVQNVIDERLELGQFDECPVTIQDLYVIRNALDNSLSGVYHSRIKYPRVKIRKESAKQDDTDEQI